MASNFSVKIFGENLRALRSTKGFSQEGFAHLAGLDRTYIGGIERGERNPGLKVIILIAKHLEVEPAELFKS